MPQQHQLHGRGAGFSRRVGRASQVEMEYFCRMCKGHYSSVVSLAALRRSMCRCGSDDLLVYSVAGDLTSPMRGLPVR